MMKTLKPEVKIGQGLIVTAIVGLLSVVLLPVLRQAQEQGNTQKCLENMAQLGKAHLQYAADWNNTFLGDDTGATQWIGYRGFNMLETPKQANPAVRYSPGLLDPYLKDENAKACPSRPKGAQAVATLNAWLPSFGYLGPKEYGPFTKRNPVTGSGQPSYIGVKNSEIESPAETFLVMEHYHSASSCANSQPAEWCKQLPNNYRPHWTSFHKEGASFTFADGHSKSIPVEKIQRRYFGVNKLIYTHVSCR